MQQDTARKNRLARLRDAFNLLLVGQPRRQSTHVPGDGTPGKINKANAELLRLIRKNIRPKDWDTVEKTLLPQLLADGADLDLAFNSALGKNLGAATALYALGAKPSLNGLQQLAKNAQKHCRDTTENLEDWFNDMDTPWEWEPLVTQLSEEHSRHPGWLKTTAHKKISNLGEIVTACQSGEALRQRVWDAHTTQELVTQFIENQNPFENPGALMRQRIGAFEESIPVDVQLALVMKMMEEQSDTIDNNNLLRQALIADKMEVANLFLERIGHLPFEVYTAVLQYRENSYNDLISSLNEKEYTRQNAELTKILCDRIPPHIDLTKTYHISSGHFYYDVQKFENISLQELMGDENHTLLLTALRRKELLGSVDQGQGNNQDGAAGLRAKPRF